MVVKDEKIQIRPGYVVCNCSSAKGGIHYERQVIEEHTINGGSGLSKRFETVKRVDNVDLVAKLDAVKKQADYQIQKHATKTEFGWFADETALAAIRESLKPLREDAQKLNQEARLRGCDRRIHINVVAAQLDLSTEETVQEIQRTIVDGLEQIHARILAGNLRNALDWKVKNLPKLAVGEGEFYIQGAIDAAQKALRIIRELAKDEVDHEVALKDPEVIEALENIENAAYYFKG